MPVGTVVNVTSEKMMLKTLPEGYVIVRRMTYGEELMRSEIATKITMGGSSTDKNFNSMIDVQTAKIALWDFAHLIVEHNIEDETGRTLDFRREDDVNRLDARIGKEIGEIIDEFNAVKDTEEVKNS